MKKILLTAILAGGTLFAANAGDFVLNLPGFFLKVGDGHTTIRTCQPRKETRTYRKPAPPKRRHEARIHDDRRKRR